MNLNKYHKRVTNAATKLGRLNEVQDLLIVLELADENNQTFLSPDSLLFWAYENGLIDKDKINPFLDWLMTEI